MFVSEYLVTEHYGGPEEGGWHYYRRHFKRLITPRHVDLATARAIAVRKNGEQRAYLDTLSYSRRYEDKISFCVESIPRTDDTSREPRPYYC